MSQSGMLFCTGQWTWQKGMPHWEQRLACSAAPAGSYSWKISSKSPRRSSASRLSGMRLVTSTNLSIRLAMV
jgi:hypothetical protein